ncbi:uncharacterized protein DS421_11g323250 [Arachis hypogaea]|nr:uncharacterized protein DS421_11g323250 [Arachis hypogaea]
MGFTRDLINPKPPLFLTGKSVVGGSLSAVSPRVWKIQRNSDAWHVCKSTMIHRERLVGSAAGHLLYDVYSGSL